MQEPKVHVVLIAALFAGIAARVAAWSAPVVPEALTHSQAASMDSCFKILGTDFPVAGQPYAPFLSTAVERQECLRRIVQSAMYRDQIVGRFVQFNEVNKAEALATLELGRDGGATLRPVKSWPGVIEFEGQIIDAKMSSTLVSGSTRFRPSDSQANAQPLSLAFLDATGRRCLVVDCFVGREGARGLVWSLWERGPKADSPWGNEHPLKFAGERTMLFDSSLDKPDPGISRYMNEREQSLLREDAELLIEAVLLGQECSHKIDRERGRLERNWTPYEPLSRLLDKDEIDLAVLDWVAAQLISELVSDRSDMYEVHPQGKQPPAVISSARIARNKPFLNAYWEKYIKGTKEAIRIRSAEQLTPAELEKHLGENRTVFLALSSSHLDQAKPEYRSAQRDMLAGMIKFLKPIQAGRIERKFGLPVLANPHLIKTDELLRALMKADVDDRVQLLRDVARELGQLPAGAVRQAAVRQADEEIRKKLGQEAASLFARELDRAIGSVRTQ